MRIHDSYTNKKREFQPKNTPIKMYVCGITPYAAAHVGHAMSTVLFDVMRRYLEYSGYVVKHIQNFTDIDDKLITASNQEGESVQTLAEYYIDEYLRHMDTLNVQRAHEYPRASQMIPEIIAMVQGLIEKGYAYESGGDVYYRVTRFASYGQLSHRTLDGMMAGARVEVTKLKEHPMDFALWKTAKPGEPSWESPWGPGRPGWHIECSAMSLALLGPVLDIHGGGQDLIFPHHENEIAQTEAYTGQSPFSHFWVHNGLLQLSDTKMSKSLGNLVTIAQALSQVSPMALRLYFLSSHYRSSLAYSKEGLATQEKAMSRLRESLLREAPDNTTGKSLDPEQYKHRFITAMDDDLNTPQALAALFDLAREINRVVLMGTSIKAAQETLEELLGVLGLTLDRPVHEATQSEPLLDILIELRSELRNTRQYDLADSIRQRLEKLGIQLEDTPTGTTWSTSN